MPSNTHRIMGTLSRLQLEATAGPCALASCAEPSIGYIQGVSNIPAGICVTHKAAAEARGYTVHTARRPLWFVADMDDGLLRAEDTRAKAVDWAKQFSDTALVRSRHCYGNHSYEYLLGTADPDEGSNFFIGRADCVAEHGWDPDQPPLYPYAEEP